MNRVTSLDRLSAARKFVTFRLDNEEYGIEIFNVREVIAMTTITRIPRASDCVRGLINLRNMLIPVLDLRIILQQSLIDYTARTCIIIVEVQAESTDDRMGIIVDEVSGVADVQQAEIEPPPVFCNVVVDDVFNGMTIRPGGIMKMLNIGRLLNGKWFN